MGATSLGSIGRTDSLRTLEQHENFPVALRVLPRDLRAALQTVYDVARTIDTLGDEAIGDRLALLGEFEADLLAAWDGQPQLPVNQALVGSVRRYHLRAEPFQALVAANRQDQVQHRYADWDALRDYCALSADPVGRIVLEVFGVATSERVSRSDDVCTALQLLEHCQDVGEDRRQGRIYLPATDLDRFGVVETALDADVAGPELRAVIEFEVARARGLLRSGRPLVASLHGWGRLAVAGFVAGGLATADAIDSAGGDVLRRPVKPRRRDLARNAAGLLAAR